ncbi:hypothetical protein HK407_03g06220 [Ordospora pajunii]|jgi:uncharacterized UPF0160 family protein|uniref:uncharacterized protein n=1 Tax=Ordospora pajunii TaxID=3039483 RepID=UPI0029526CE7|nr:uncharacterized protein HK407_03g06220 [Ordospora pajunii]KAH9411870.1 hypothetical protein HK407_03g06220 [Ordospora pajunii]
MKLVTHNGRFHYDEVLSTAMLLRMYPNAEVERTRDKAVFEQGDIVYDVGGIFDPERKRFDHHQPSFTETFSEKYSIKLSSCGLVFKYMHKDFLSLYGIKPDIKIYQTIVDKVYSEFFLYADAIDNGCDISGDISIRSMADFVVSFNADESSGDMEKIRFKEVLKIVGRDLDNYMDRVSRWANNYVYAEKMISEANDELLVLDKYCNPDLILEVEKKYNKDIKLIIFPSADVYKIIAIPKFKGTFETKNPLKKEWRGLKDEELVEVSGIEGSVFVHVSGFLGINQTLENAVKMARMSLEANIE